MCPTANEASFLLESQTFPHRAIKLIGSGLRLADKNAYYFGYDFDASPCSQSSSKMRYLNSTE
jgi:hypothetical protein